MLQHANHRTGLKPNVSRRQRRRSSFYRHFAVSMPSNDCRGHCGVSGLIREFNTTLFLVGPESPLTITKHDRMAKVGSTPVLNAVSFFLIIGAGLLVLLSVLVQRDKSSG